MYEKAMRKLQAEEGLMALRTSAFPHLKKDRQQKIVRDLEKDSRAGVDSKKRALTAKELEAFING